MKNNKKLHKFFSVLLGFCFCLCPFLSMPLKEEKASALSEEEYSIYDYEWANYFDCSKIDTSRLTYDDSYFFIQYDFSDPYNPIITFTAKSNFTAQSPLICNTIIYYGSFSTSSFSDCLSSEAYTFYCSNDISADSSTVVPGLRFRFMTPNSETWFYRGESNSFSSYSLSDVITCSIGLVFSSGDTISAGTTFTLSNLALYKASYTNFEFYTPYFYSLESIPDNAPDNPDNPDNPDYPDNPVIPDVPIVSTSGVASFFTNCTVRLEALMSDGTVQELENIEPQYVYGGITLAPYYSQIASLSGIFNRVSGVRFSVFFNAPVFGFLLHVQGIGNVDAFSQRLTINYKDTNYDTENFNTVGRFVSFPDNAYIGYGLQSSNIDLSQTQYMVTSLTNWTIYDLENISNLVLVDYTFNFSAGFEYGKETGYAEGLQEATALYKDTWFQQGYNKGFAEGVEDDNDFLALANGIASVPVTLLTSIFDFNILGFNMKTVLFGILSAMLIVALIFFFTKGKNE